MLAAWFPWFLLTLAIELPVMIALAGRGHRARMVLVGGLVNLFTHPLVTLVWWSWPLPAQAPADASPPLWLFVVLEVAVIATETALVRYAVPLRWRHALLVAGTANVVSAAVSPVLV